MDEKKYSYFFQFYYYSIFISNFNSSNENFTLEIEGFWYNDLSHLDTVILSIDIAKNKKQLDKIKDIYIRSSKKNYNLIINIIENFEIFAYYNLREKYLLQNPNQNDELKFGVDLRINKYDLFLAYYSTMQVFFYLKNYSHSSVTRNEIRDDIDDYIYYTFLNTPINIKEIKKNHLTFLIFSVYRFSYYSIKEVNIKKDNSISDIYIKNLEEDFLNFYNETIAPIVFYLIWINKVDIREFDDIDKKNVLEFIKNFNFWSIKLNTLKMKEDASINLFIDECLKDYKFSQTFFNFHEERDFLEDLIVIKRFFQIINISENLKDIDSKLTYYSINDDFLDDEDLIDEKIFINDKLKNLIDKKLANKNFNNNVLYFSDKKYTNIVNEVIDKVLFLDLLKIFKKLGIILVEHFFNIEVINKSEIAHFDEVNAEKGKIDLNLIQNSTLYSYIFYTSFDGNKKNVKFDYLYRYTLNQKFKLNLYNDINNKLNEIINLDMLHLTWKKHSKLKNPFIHKNQIIKQNIRNKHKSNFDTEKLKYISKNQLITYYDNYKINFNSHVNFNLLTQDLLLSFCKDNKLDNFDLLNPLTFEWSEITFDNYLNNSYFAQLFYFISQVKRILQVNRILIYSIFWNNKIDLKISQDINFLNKYIGNYHTILDYISQFVDKLFEDRNDIELVKQLMISYLGNISNILDFFSFCKNSKNILAIKENYNFLLSHKEFLANDFLKHRETLYDYEYTKDKHGEFSDYVDKKLTNIVKIIRVMGKNISSYLNYSLLYKNYIYLLQHSEYVNYSYFFDFRGRIYPNASEFSWVNNALLRLFIKIKQPEIISYVNFNIENNITDIIKNFIYNFLNINENFYYYDYIKSFIYIYSWSIGSILDKNLSKQEQVVLALDLINDKNTQLNYFNKKTYDCYVKFKLFEANLNFILDNCSNSDIFKTKVLPKLNECTIIIDSVSNGFTHVVGLTKHLDEDLLLYLLTLGNYIDEKQKYDLYMIIAERMIKSLENEIILNHIKSQLSKYLNDKGLDMDQNILIKIFSNIINLRKVIITRKTMKKPVMTVLYSSTFRTWLESIHEVLLESNSFNCEKLFNHPSFIDLLKIFSSLGKDRNFLISVLSYVVTITFNHKENSDLLVGILNNMKKNIRNALQELFKNIEESQDEKKKTKLKSKGIELVFKTKNYRVSLNYYKNDLRIQYKIGGEYGRNNKISYHELMNLILDWDKMFSSMIPNMIHSCDGSICINFSDSIKKDYNINTVTIHDCFVIPWYSFEVANKLYNTLYYNFYEENNLYNCIYYVDETINEDVRLFKDEDLHKYLNQNLWKNYKDKILNAKNNLSFE